MSSTTLLQSSLASASSLIGLQVFTRLFTFILNQALLRIASPRAFGTAAIQFELLLNTILFLSREGVREASLRFYPTIANSQRSLSSTTSKPKPNENPAESEASIEDANVAVQSFTNLTFLPFLIGLPVTIITTYYYRLYAADETKSQPYFHEAISTYAIAALVELLCEPMHNLAVTSLRTSARVRAEGLGVTLKSITTFLILFYDYKLNQSHHHPDSHTDRNPNSREGDSGFALLAFAFGQLAYSVTLLLAYVGAFWSEQARFRFKELGVNASSRVASYFNPLMFRLAMTVNAQSLLKHLLTESDKLVLSYFSPLSAQGGYAIAANYGSLIARLVFQPIEEILRLFFSRILSTPSPSSQNHNSPSSSSQNIPSSSAQGRPSPQALLQVRISLTTLLQTQISFSLILITFAHIYLPYLLPLLLPRQFFLHTNAAELLKVWVWCLPFLAINGGLEAFVAVASQPKDLLRQSFFMFLFSLLYLLSTFTLHSPSYFNLGDSSLIYANILNLSFRILYCLHFIRRFFKKHFSPVRPSAASNPDDPSSFTMDHGMFVNSGATQAAQRYPFHLTFRECFPHPKLVIACGLSYIVLTSSSLLPLPLSASSSHISYLFSLPVLLYIAIGGLLGIICVYVYWLTLGRGLRDSLSGRVASGHEDVKTE